MVVMSNYLNQAGKETLSNTVFIPEAIPKSFYGPPKEVTTIDKLQSTPQPVGAPHLTSAMPEPYLSAGGYYANNTGFPMSYANFSQPAPWSTGTSNQQAAPQNFDHTAMQYSTLSAPPPTQTNADGPQNHQFVAADHLFNQQNPFSANPYMNGSWSYFNNASSIFFPTGNGDLNLTWGTAATENPQNSALFQDLYKPPLPPVDHEKHKVEPVVPSELSSAFDNRDVKTVEDIEQSFSAMNMNSAIEKEKETVNDNCIQSVSSVASTVSSKSVSPHVKVSPTSASSGQSNAPAKPVSWAAVASQPAKNKVPPKKPPPKTTSTTPNGKVPSHSSHNGTSISNNTSKSKQQSNTAGRYRQNQGNNNNAINDVEPEINDSHLDINRLKDSSPLLKKLMVKYNFNPRDFNIDLKNARFFIIKSYSEDDIFRSIKYSSWTSTEHGNRRLNEAFNDQKKTGIKTPLYLLFSVNSSGHFCGVAEMKSDVDINVETGIWVQDKWKGRFSVRWIYVKDVPNSTLRHIRLENNENKPVTNSRDTQEVHPDKGKQVLTIIHNYKAQTSIFDDFSHYEKRQEEDAKMRSKKMPDPESY